MACLKGHKEASELLWAWIARMPKKSIGTVWKLFNDVTARPVAMARMVPFVQVTGTWLF